MKKAQAAIEFVIVIATIFFLFGIILFLTLDKRIELNDKELFVDMTSNCVRMANFINKAFILGDGIEIKTKTNYDIFFLNNEMLYIKDSNVQCDIITSPVNNNGESNFSITNGDIKIINQENDIIIENV